MQRENASMAKQVKKQATRKPVRHYVKQWREYRQLTQSQVAERVDKSRGLIAQIEGDITDLTEDMIYALAEAFHCQPWDILRVNPLKEGVVVDITDELKKHPELQAETLGYIRGRLVNC